MKWIPAEVKPETNGEYLIFMPVVGFKLCYFEDGYWTEGDHIKKLMTHWMKLEEPVDHECKFYVNADWTGYSRCECGKEHPSTIERREKYSKL